MTNAVNDIGATTSRGYRLLWAKSEPRHPLWKHLLDAAAVSVALNTAPPLPWTANHVAFVVGLHDIGKADAGFQHQVPDFSESLTNAGFPVTNDARCRHERLSARFVRNKLAKAGMEDVAASAIARAVLAHHGYWNEAARDVAPEYAQAQGELCQLLHRVLGANELPTAVASDLSDFGMRLAGQIVLCDWIASNEEFFTNTLLAGIEEPGQYFEKTMIVARKWVEKLSLDRDKSSGKPRSIVSYTRPIQKMLLDTSIAPGLVIIEAPMGEGKTEAAWILAEKWRDHGYYGMYMALPTMATSDSLHGRYRDDYLKKLGRGEDTKLVHGMAWLRDQKEPQKLPEVGELKDEQATGARSVAAAWFRPTRRAMLAAHGVGTVDQAMLAGMHVKFGFLRLFGLADRVLVIDEVHAYDAYMSAIIGRLLQWCACLRIPVILLSATLSAKQRAAMMDAYGASGGDPGPEADYPLITVGRPGDEVRTIAVTREKNAETPACSSRSLGIERHPGLLGDAKKTAAKAAELVDAGGCCCVILNTVKQAQAVYKELRLPEGEKLLFHARFTATDRQTLTERVLAMFGKESTTRPQKFVLVATQVVEQSLDVDFDHMISDIAPVDLLLQRSGRIKRHTRDNKGKVINGSDQRSTPVLHVLLPAIEKKDKKNRVEKPAFGPSQIIYQRYPLLQTLALLNANRDIELPSKFRALIEAVYTDDVPVAASEDLRQAHKDWMELQEDLAAQAREFLLCEPMPDEFDPVGTDEVGDDSDDGNGWRARTRLGLEDVLVIAVAPEELARLGAGDLPRETVKRLYMQSLKIPCYYWPPRAAKGCGQPILGEKKLRGAWLVPVKKTNGAWSWSGLKEDGKSYDINYDPTIGLTHGADK